MITNTDIVPDTVLSALQILTHLILNSSLWGGYNYPHFTDEETEAQTG